MLSGSDHWTLADDTRQPTGYWAEEMGVPHSARRAVLNPRNLAEVLRANPDAFGFSAMLPAPGVALPCV
jgi:hypothetical protein